MQRVSARFQAPTVPIAAAARRAGGRAPLHWFWLALLLGALTACQPLPERDATRGAASTEAAATAAELPALIEARLQLAREVAWSKFHSGAPVHDPQREAELLDALQRQGEALGLPPARVRRFFEAQIAASRAVQTTQLAAWHAGAPRPAHPPLDLRTDLRPRLDRLTARLLQALADPASADPSLQRRSEELLRVRHYPPEAIALAIAPLRR